ncbi:MAG: hypothetical protein WBW33_16255 [Bryobacteraceae bacterium]
MLRKQFSILVLSLGILWFAGPVAASALTSSNGLDNVGYSFGQTTSVYAGWAATLATFGGEPTGFYGTPSFTAGSQTFDITGYTGSVNSPYGYADTGGTAVPIVITMPSWPALTGLELGLIGTPSVTVTLSDGSTVTTGPLSFGSGQDSVTFTSPLQIIAVEIDSSVSGTSLWDLSWGTADPAQLPEQPVQGGGDGGGDQSPTPEGSTLWLMGSGLLGLSHLIRKRKHLLN